MTKTMIRNSHPLREKAEKAGLPLLSIGSYVFPQLNRAKLDAARELKTSKLRFPLTLVAILAGQYGTLCRNVKATQNREVLSIAGGAVPTDLFGSGITLCNTDEFVKLVRAQNAPTRVFHRKAKTSYDGMLYGKPGRPYTTLVSRRNGAFEFRDVKTTVDGHNTKDVVSLEGMTDKEKAATVSAFTSGKSTSAPKKGLKFKARRK